MAKTKQNNQVQKYESEFLELFKKLTCSRSSWQVWEDLVTVMACSISNAADRSPDKFKRREEQYDQAIKNLGGMEIPVQIFCTVVKALEENPNQDFLGRLYMALNLGSHWHGQFFTPYHISEFMSEIQFPGTGADEMPEGKGYISVNDPACGAGAMLIAFANVAKKHGINYQKQVLFVAQDIDRTAAMMCYIQLSLLGCPAIVVIGDSLAKPFPHPDNEMWCTMFYYLNQWRFAPGGEGEKQEGSVDMAEGGTATVSLEHPSGNIRLLEGTDGQLMLCMEPAS